MGNNKIKVQVEIYTLIIYEMNLGLFFQYSMKITFSVNDEESFLDKFRSRFIQINLTFMMINSYEECFKKHLLQEFKFFEKNNFVAV